MDSDLQLALILHRELNSDPSPVPAKKVKKSRSEKENSIVNPEWEITDPNPDIHSLFQVFDRKYFWGRLDCVEVKWSPRMYSCAGICTYKGKWGGCVISLSLPLLKLRPRKDLVETLLHEMIHAFLFVADKNRDRGEHGPKFHEHMYRINKEAGTNITVYHTFHDEVKHYKQHWWRCNGPCQAWKPFFGLVKRSMNRAPGPNDFWFADHQAKCGGEFIKVKEPENFKSRKPRGEKKIEKSTKGSIGHKGPASLLNFFSQVPSPGIGSSKINSPQSKSSASGKSVTNGDKSNKNNYFSKVSSRSPSNSKINSPQNKSSASGKSVTKGDKSNTNNYVSKVPSRTPSNSKINSPLSKSSASGKSITNGDKSLKNNYFSEVSSKSKSNSKTNSNSPQNRPGDSGKNTANEVKSIKNNNTSAKIENYKKIGNVHGFTNLSKPVQSPTSNPATTSKGSSSSGFTGMKSNKGGTFLLNPKPSTSQATNKDEKSDTSSPSKTSFVAFSGSGHKLSSSNSAPSLAESRSKFLDKLIAKSSSESKVVTAPPSSKTEKQSTSPSRASTKRKAPSSDQLNYEQNLFQNELNSIVHIPDAEEESEIPRVSENIVHCPVCNKAMPECDMNEHLDLCTTLDSVFENSVRVDLTEEMEAEDETPGNSSLVNCPSCGYSCSEQEINDHLDMCLN